MKNLVFDSNPQFNFCVADYDIFDKNISSYETDPLSEFEFDFRLDSFSFKTEIDLKCDSVMYKILNDEFGPEPQSASMNVLYEERSDPNKQSHFEETVVPQAQKDQLMNSSNRLKKKRQKKIEKKTKLQSLIEMFNDIFEIYDKSISIQQMLKTSRVDMS